MDGSGMEGTFLHVTGFCVAISQRVTIGAINQHKKQVKQIGPAPEDTFLPTKGSLRLKRNSDYWA
jgi:hypothetical protein